jgi:hypothetical protein
MRPADSLDFPSSAGEFYRLRDDRTNRCVSATDYQAVGCSVTIDPDVAKTLAGQVMLVATCSLLSRWCRRIEIVLPDIALKSLVHPRGIEIQKLVQSSMYDADPFGEFSISNRPGTRAEFLRLHIGPSPSKDSITQVVINSSGWLASIATGSGPELVPTNDGNIIGAVAAAYLGGAQLFKRAVGVDERPLLAIAR